MSREQKPNEESETKFEKSSSEGRNRFFDQLKMIIFKYKPIVWNVVLLFTGFYLVWATMSVLLTILGFAIGVFFVIFALSELGLLHPAATFSFILRMLRTR